MSSTTTATHSHEVLNGGYTIVAGEKYGEAIPSEHIAGSTVRIADNAIVVTDKDKKDVYAATYEVLTGDPAGPWKIRMTSKVVPESEPKDRQQTVEGLIDKKGDVVRLIYALEGESAPTGFKTGPGELMFEMKNLHK